MIQTSAYKNWRFGFFFWGILILTAILLLLGYANLVNADFYSQNTLHHRQALWIVVGLVVMAGVTLADRSFIELFSDVFYWLVVVLLVVVLIWGKKINHSRRWLFFLGMALEPSEFAKPAVIMLVAKHLHYIRRTGNHTLMTLLKPMAMVFLPAVLIMMEPDLGTSIVLMLVAFSMLLFDGIRWKTLAAIGVTLVIFAPIAWFTGIIRDYQKDRIQVWLHLTDKKNKKKHKDTGMQPRQALWAVGSGGINGKGVRRASQSRLKYLAEMHTDFIFGIYAEERGFIGSFFLILLYFGLIGMMLGAAIRARDRFGVLLCVGVGIYLFWQSFFNLGMVSGLFPVVGLTLPLLSYGGSSLLTTLFLFGLALNVAVADG